jgi:hypothetical protein
LDRLGIGEAAMAQAQRINVEQTREAMTNKMMTNESMRSDVLMVVLVIDREAGDALPSLHLRNTDVSTEDASVEWAVMRQGA